MITQPPHFRRSPFLFLSYHSASHPLSLTLFSSSHHSLSLHFFPMMIVIFLLLISNICRASVGCDNEKTGVLSAAKLEHVQRVFARDPELSEYCIDGTTILAFPQKTRAGYNDTGERRVKLVAVQEKLEQFGDSFYRAIDIEGCNDDDDDKGMLLLLKEKRKKDNDLSQQSKYLEATGLDYKGIVGVWKGGKRNVGGIINGITRPSIFLQCAPRPVRLCRLLMREARGRPLVRLLRDPKFMNRTMMERIVWAVERALNDFHSHGYTHNGLGPSNLIYDEELDVASIINVIQADRDVKMEQAMDDAISSSSKSSLTKYKHLLHFPRTQKSATLQSTPKVIFDHLISTVLIYRSLLAVQAVYSSSAGKFEEWQEMLVMLRDRILAFHQSPYIRYWTDSGILISKLQNELGFDKNWLLQK